MGRALAFILSLLGFFGASHALPEGSFATNRRLGAPAEVLVLSQSALAGTYEISICRAPCGGGVPAGVQGHLVLFQAAIPHSRVPKDLHDWFFYDLLDANGCYALQPTEEWRHTYAGIKRGAGTWWEQNPDSMVTLVLYTSPDADHTATLMIRNGVLAGRGKSSGAGMAAVGWEPDYIVGRRIGPPDASRCIRALREEVEEDEKRRRMDREVPGR